MCPIYFIDCLYSTCIDIYKYYLSKVKNKTILEIFIIFILRSFHRISTSFTHIVFYFLLAAIFFIFAVLCTWKTIYVGRSYNSFEKNIYNLKNLFN